MPKINGIPPAQGLVINCFNVTVIVTVYFNGCQLLMIKVLIFLLETDVCDNILHKPLKFEFSSEDPLGVRHDELSSKSFSNMDTDK